MVRFAVPPKVTLLLIVATPVLLMSDVMLPFNVSEPPRRCQPSMSHSWKMLPRPTVLLPLVRATVPAFGRESMPVVLTVPWTVTVLPAATSIAPAAPEIPLLGLNCNSPAKVLLRVPLLKTIGFGCCAKICV